MIDSQADLNTDRLPPENYITESEACWKYFLQASTALIYGPSLQEENYRTFFNTIDEFLIVLNMQGYIKKVNRAVIERLGYAEGELLGRSVVMLHPEDRRAEAEARMPDLISGKEKTCLVPLISKNGDIIPVETMVGRGMWSGQEALFGVSKDVSELKLSEEKFSKAFYINPSIMAISTIDEGRYIDINWSFCEKLEYKREEVINHTYQGLNIFMDNEVRPRIISVVLNEGRIRDYEVWLRSKRGKEICGLYSADIIYLGAERFLLTMINDISEQRRMEKELQDMNSQLQKLNESLHIQAITDSLTGLFNHKHIIETLQSEIDRAKRYGQMLSVMMLDIDHFKRVNDEFGHQAGDQVLVELAAIVRNNLRIIDIAGRYGGEEFLLILPQTGIKSALQVAERIRKQIQTADFKDWGHRITSSIGVAQYSNGDEAESLINRADRLLYRAKLNGRNRIES